MERLEPHELNCLRALAHNPAANTSHCSVPTLAKLMAAGLVQSTAQLQLPLVWSHLSYTLTDYGREYLSRMPRE